MLKGLYHHTEEGRRQAIECLYLICWPLVKSMVIRNSGTKADAEDVFQDTILAFLHNVEKGKTLTSTLKDYFYIIARNLWFKRLQRRPKTNEFNEAIVVELDNGPEIEKLLEYERRYQVIEDCKTKLSKQCREIIDSIYQQDRSSMAEVAENQKLANPHTARQIKYRCLKKLKSCVRKRLANLD